MPEKNEPQEVDPGPLELTVIGFALQFPERFYDVEDLHENIFSEPNRRKIFGVMKSLAIAHGPISLSPPSLVIAKLTDAGMKEDTAMEIITLARDYAPRFAGMIGGVKDQLLHIAMRRAIGEAGENLQTLSRNNLTADQLADQASSVVNNALKQATTVEVVSMADAMELELKRIESDNVSESIGYSTGIMCLDDMITGLHPGEMVVIAGRPGHGKTALLQKIALHLAAFQGLPGLLVTLEMKVAEFVQRLLCNAAGCNMHAARMRSLAPPDLARYKGQAKTLAQAPLVFNDKGGITMPRLQALARRMHYERQIKWIAIDYVQLMDHLPRGSESTENCISRTSNALKALALSLDCPVIVLSQLNRQCEQRDNKRPRASDLRSSGALEQDADVIIMVYRDSVYWTKDQQEEHKEEKYEAAELIIAKQRNGPMGTIPVTWQRKNAEFMDPIQDGLYTTV